MRERWEGQSNSLIHSSFSSIYLLGISLSPSVLLSLLYLLKSVARRKPLLSERHLKACLEFAKKHLKDSQTVRDKVLVNYNWHVQRKPGTAHHLPDTIPGEKHGGVAASCFRGAFQWQGLGNWLELRESRTGQITEISVMKTWPAVLRTWDLAEGSPSNRTVTLNTQPRQCSSDLGTPLWMSVSGPARALTWTTSKSSGVKWNLTELERNCSEEWQKIPKSRCAKFVMSYPRRLDALMAAKGASTKYWVKDLNTDVNVIFSFY